MRSSGFSAKSSSRLYKGMCTPVVDYASEVLTPNKGTAKEIEKDQLRIGRAILGLNTHTSKEVILGELGWSSMEARRDMLKLRYYGRLVRMQPTRLVRRIFVARYYAYAAGVSAHGWSDTISGLLGKYDLEQYIDTTSWPNFLRREAWEVIVDNAVAKHELLLWQTGMADKTTLERYRRIQKAPGMDLYLDSVSQDRPSVRLKTRLRAGMNALAASLARHKGTWRSPLCQVCRSGVIEDEQHFVDVCGPLDLERKRMWDDCAAVYEQTDKVRAMSSPDRTDFVLGCPASDEPAVERVFRLGLLRMWRVRTAVLYPPPPPLLGSRGVFF